MKLERLLTEVGAEYPYPPTPDLVTRVTGRLVTKRRRPRRLRAVVAGAAAILTFVLVSPPLRYAVADLLGIGRVRVETIATLPSVGTSLGLGEEVSLAEAERRASVPVVIPTALGPPDAVYLTDDGGVVLVYSPRRDLPEVLDTGVGAIFAVLPSVGPPVIKQVAPGTDVTYVTVSEGPALWLAGAPHAAFLRGAPAAGRLAANTLVWESDDVTFRLEAAIDLGQALHIAESTPSR